MSQSGELEAPKAFPRLIPAQPGPSAGPLVDRRQLGTTTITATAGCSSQTVVIRVEDTEAPVISCPGDFGLCTDAGQCYATVDLNGFVSVVAVTGVMPLANC